MPLFADLTRENTTLAAERDQLRQRRAEILDALLLATAELERQAPVLQAALHLERVVLAGDDAPRALAAVLGAAERYRSGDA